MPALIERTATGKKPDWGDIMFNVDQKSTPFFNAVPKGSKPENTLFQWNVDAYAPPAQKWLLNP